MTKAIEDIMAEKKRGLEKWGGEKNDDSRLPKDWCIDIEAYVKWAAMKARSGTTDEYRKRMIQVAGLALNAVESHDRIRQPMQR